MQLSDYADHCTFLKWNLKFLFNVPFSGPLCSILVERFGCRITVMVGGLLSGVGMVASAFSNSLSQLYLTAGFITGEYSKTTMEWFVCFPVWFLFRVYIPV